jgi:hypothetical protein
LAEQLIVHRTILDVQVTTHVFVREQMISLEFVHKVADVAVGIVLALAAQPMLIVLAK